MITPGILSVPLVRRLIPHEMKSQPAACLAEDSKVFHLELDLADVRHYLILLTVRVASDVSGVFARRALVRAHS